MSSSKSNRKNLRAKRLENWMDDCDTVFKTLVMPVSFVLTIVWAPIFIFLEETNIEILASLILHLATFILSVLFWGISVFAKRQEIRSKQWKRSINYKNWALALLWVSLLATPWPLFTLVFSQFIAIEFTLLLFFVFFYLPLLIFIRKKSKLPR